MRRIAAVIFAKKSERFPGKHMHRVNGITLIDHVGKKLHESGLFSRVVVFTKDPEVKSAYADVVADHSEGTLIDSIRTAVEAYGDVFAFGGDMPLISVDLVRNMLREYDGVPICPLLDDGRLEPLHAIYNGSLTNAMIEYSRNEGKSIREFIRSAPFRFFKVRDGDAFFNVNYSEDVSKLP